MSSALAHSSDVPISARCKLSTDQANIPKQSLTVSAFTGLLSFPTLRPLSTISCLRRSVDFRSICALHKFTDFRNRSAPFARGAKMGDVGFSSATCMSTFRNPIRCLVSSPKSSLLSVLSPKLSSSLASDWLLRQPSPPCCYCSGLFSYCLLG